MSKVFIATANAGKAHDADIFSVSACNSFTVSCSGDGYLKVWDNKLLDNENPKDKSYSHFVHKSGLHHVDVLQTIERDAFELCLVATTSFSGDLFFYRITREDETKKVIFEKLDLLDSDMKKHSFWALKWGASNDRLLSHRLVATDVKGTTYIWKFHPCADESDSSTLNWSPTLELQGTVESPMTPSQFATSVDISERGLIATGFNNGTVQISELSTLRPLYNFESQHSMINNSNSIRSVKFSPQGSLLAIAHDSNSFGCITLYETEFGERIGSLSVPTHSSQASLGEFAHSSWVMSLSFNDSGETLCSAGWDGKLRFWDVKTKERITTLNMHCDDIEIEEDILAVDEHGDSLAEPGVFDVKFLKKGWRSGMGADLNESLCCVCLDRSIRWFREAGGK